MEIQQVTTEATAVALSESERDNLHWLLQEIGALNRLQGKYREDDGRETKVSVQYAVQRLRLEREIAALLKLEKF